MRKLNAGLGLCLTLLAAGSLQAQDPFVQSFDPLPEEAPVLVLPTPPAEQSEPPIIQTMPTERTRKATATRSIPSRTENAQVRNSRTPAEEYIYQRAQYRAKLRTSRIAARKARNVSLLRPNVGPDQSWWYQYNYDNLPIWGYAPNR